MLIVLIIAVELVNLELLLSAPGFVVVDDVVAVDNCGLTFVVDEAALATTVLVLFDSTTLVFLSLLIPFVMVAAVPPGGLAFCFMLDLPESLSVFDS